MRFEPLHRWDVTPAEAVRIQRELASRVIARDDFGKITTVAGVDVGFEQDGTVTRAAVAVLDFPGLGLREQSVARLPTSFPYIPGLLSFREIPAVLKAMEGLESMPDMLLCDGQGRAHPRRFGIACHLGVWTGIPAIGVGKTRLVGHYLDPADEKGAWTPLIDGEECIGAVLRSRRGVKPVFVSPGHRIGLQSAISMVMACVTRYKLPETTRHAHRLASN